MKWVYKNLRISLIPQLCEKLQEGDNWFFIYVMPRVLGKVVLLGKIGNSLPMWWVHYLDSLSSFLNRVSVIKCVLMWITEVIHEFL